ncbi:uncharacterized protein [Mycetomoellerius zeteki]|uniref:uncharacterized protein n=1 Tax=Mycetomoellerius zeteki TaxID=64791 RepID=UPI00084E4503|nr:PREDICTED: uncharacterized protein LOC108728255 [Trachymyrmex zeteki]
MGAANDKPTALGIHYRLRWYILGKHSADVFTEGSNTVAHNSTMDETCLTSGIDVDSMEESLTEDDVECEILNVTDFQNELLDDYEVDVDIATYTLNYIPFLEEQALLHEVDTLDVIEEEGLKYIADYVAYRFMH